LIRAELVRTNFLTRWHCHVCGGRTEKNLILCEVPESHPTHGGLRICERCLKSRDFDAKLAEQAAALEAHAASLRGVIGHIEAPSFEDWKHADALANALWDTETDWEDAMTWPREKREAAIAEAVSRWATEQAERARRRGELPDADDELPW
jgi:hypothetical protein